MVPAIVFGYIWLVLVLTVYRLGPRDGDFQRRIHALIAEQAGTEPGTVLDIGCGSGSLTVAVATTAPECTVAGIDSWGDDWEYSQQQCQRNARCAGATDRVTFSRQSAAALTFPDAGFDTVVSCLTFHEVLPLPYPLRDRKVLGYAMLLTGVRDRD
jgi:ubiquinone/menaquinone biosynthesis C-methylase UbiE